MPHSYKQSRISLSPGAGGSAFSVLADDVNSIQDAPGGGTVVVLRSAFDTEDTILTVSDPADLVRVRLQEARAADRHFQQVHLRAIMNRYQELGGYGDSEAALVFESLWEVNPDIMANLVAGGSFLVRALQESERRPTVVSAQLLYDLAAIRLV